MRDDPSPNNDGPVAHQPQEMKDPDEQEDAARDDQIQLVAHVVTPTLSA